MAEFVGVLMFLIPLGCIVLIGIYGDSIFKSLGSGIFWSWVVITIILALIGACTRSGDYDSNYYLTYLQAFLLAISPWSFASLILVAKWLWKD